MNGRYRKNRTLNLTRDVVAHLSLSDQKVSDEFDRIQKEKLQRFAIGFFIFVVDAVLIRGLIS